MRIDGIAGIYKKTYLDNDMYLFEYSHYVDGYFDTETNTFYDENDKVIPFIRDIDFLESKEIIGYHDFLSYEQFTSVYSDIDAQDYQDFYNAYDIDEKSKLLLVNVLDDYNKKDKTTVLTDIDLSRIHIKAASYFMDFVNKNGENVFNNLFTMDYNRPIEDVIKFVNAGVYSLEELNHLLEVYKQPYEDAMRVMDLCEAIIVEYSEDNNILKPEERNPEFDFSKPINISDLLDILAKRQISVSELKDLYKFYSEQLAQFKEVLEAINNDLSRIEESIKKEDGDMNVQVTLENQENIEETEKYSLDDLKKLRGAVKEYLVGQDEPLKRLVSELSRMKDKNFEDNVGILLSGDSGVGKTFMVQLVAKFLGVPFVRVDSTDLTIPGYIGKDLEEVLWELYEKSGKNKEAAEHGILFFDEIDKKGSNRKDDVSGMGVLNHLLTLIDGNDVTACRSTKSIGMQEEVKLNSKHMIIIAAGSFPDVYKAKKSNMGFISNDNEKDEYNPSKTPSTNVFVEKAMISSDFMNRLPIRIRLNELKEKDFEDNFKYGKDSPIKWEETSFSKYGVKLTVTPEFIKKASELSLKEGSGFRGSKGLILTATSAALDDVKENEGMYEEIVLSDETLDNPYVYKKVLKHNR